MHLGMIGLGRMGASLVRRLAKDGHPRVVSLFTFEDAVEAAWAVVDPGWAHAAAD